jgi:hypothetical protein
MPWSADRIAKGAIGILLTVMALLNFARAIRGHRRGQADWHAGRGLDLSADREDDPVGFTTAVWGNVAAGLFALGMAAAINFG